MYSLDKLTKVIDESALHGRVAHIPRPKFMGRKQEIVMPHWGGYNDGYGQVTLGGTKTGKTETTVWCLSNWIDFDTLIVCAAQVDHDAAYAKLYNWAVTEKESRGDNDRPFNFLFIKTLSELPPIDSFTNNDFTDADGDSMLLGEYRDRRTYVIIDDMVTQKNQAQVCDYYIRCRKYNCSIEYITQDWRETPALVKKNAFVFRIHRGLSKANIKGISNKISHSLDSDEFYRAYEYATQVNDDDLNYQEHVCRELGVDTTTSDDIRPFMVIDNTVGHGNQIRKNFTEVLYFE